MSGSAASSKDAKPQLRGLLHSQIKRNLQSVAVSVVIAFVYMKFVYGHGKKRQYAEFYKNYDIDQEFERMRKKGLFDSCDID